MTTTYGADLRTVLGEDFAAAFRGELVGPGDHDYDAGRAV